MCPGTAWQGARGFSKGMWEQELTQVEVLPRPGPRATLVFVWAAGKG